MQESFLYERRIREGCGRDKEQYNKRVGRGEREREDEVDNTIPSYIPIQEDKQQNINENRRKEEDWIKLKLSS